MSPTLAKDAACVRVITASDRRRLESLLLTKIGQRSALSTDLAHALARARVVPAARVPRDVVTMNSIVGCPTRAGVHIERKLVYPWDAVDVGYVSVLSPLGLALLGNRVGARLPAELDRCPTAPWAISQLLYQPEEAGDPYR